LPVDANDPVNMTPLSLRNSLSSSVDVSFAVLVSFPMPIRERSWRSWSSADASSSSGTVLPEGLSGIFTGVYNEGPGEAVTAMEGGVSGAR